MPTKPERFFVVEIARMLRCRPKEVRAVLRPRGMLRVIRSQGGRRSEWTTARGLQIVLVVVRARQGEAMMQGRDPIELADRQAPRNWARLAAMALNRRAVKD